MNHDKPFTPGEFIAHYGVKGMKWGVHKKEDSSGGTSSGSGPSMSLKEHASTKEYMAIKTPHKTAEQAKASLIANQKKSAAKLEPSVSAADASNPKHQMTPEQKAALLKLGVGVAVVGGLTAYAAYNNKKLISEFSALSGRAISADKFNEAVGFSKMKTWGFGGYIQDSSYRRAEFTLPAGHTFHRISTTLEDSFKPGTYATHSIEDFNRYVAAFRHEKGALADLQHLTFTTTKELKVPSLTTTLDTLGEVMSKDAGFKMDKKSVKSMYEMMSGGGWVGSTQEGLFKALAEKGYGAIVDEMDAGVIGETPLVVFAQHLTSKVGEPLTEAAINAAESNLTELRNRKF